LRHAVTARVPWLELEAPEAMQVNLDGHSIHPAGTVRLVGSSAKVEEMR